MPSKAKTEKPKTEKKTEVPRIEPFGHGRERAVEIRPLGTGEPPELRPFRVGT